jgi:hypothetical protein
MSPHVAATQRGRGGLTWEERKRTDDRPKHEQEGYEQPHVVARERPPTITHVRVRLVVEAVDPVAWEALQPA